jgi:CRP-like cAMP-binding protein
MSAVRRRLSKAEFYINADEREATYYFAAENEFISDYPSFLPQRPSDKNIQALEPAEIHVISFDNLQRFYQHISFGERFGRLIAEEIFVDSIQQLASFYQDKPAIRYQNFVHRFPQLVQRLPQYYIASYVGIEPQSLSRIRRRFRSNKYLIRLVLRPATEFRFTTRIVFHLCGLKAFETFSLDSSYCHFCLLEIGR